MKLPIPFSRFAGLAVGSMVMGAALLPAEGQGSVDTINWSGTVNQVWGTGDGIANGANVNGSISFNPAALLLAAGNGSTTAASLYSDTFAVTIDGTTSTVQGTLDVFHNTLDANGVLSDGVSFVWGGASGLFFNYAPNTVSSTSAASGLQMLNMGLNGALAGDAVFDIADASGNNGVQGNITSFTITTNSPSARALFVKLSGGNAVVSYPTNTIGFQLQSSPYLGANANWKAVTNAPVLIGTNNNITLPIVPGSQFFRLGPTN